MCFKDCIVAIWCIDYISILELILKNSTGRALPSALLPHFLFPLPNVIPFTSKPLTSAVAILCAHT